MSALNAHEFDRLSNEVLTALEIREARLLNWGFMQVTQELRDMDAQLPELLKTLPYNSPELAALWERARATNINGREFLDNLVQRKLIFRSGGDRYRTRFAETVRLLFLLRQRFSENDWRTGERLVGDLRILLQRRRFPRRELSPEKILDQIEGLSVSAIRRAAVSALLHEEDEPIYLAQFQSQAITRIFRNLGSTHDTAVVIGAGTGAGKTKAFYIPALAFIAETLESKPYVAALALYPRIELLKDQLRETFAEARKLDRLLQQQRKRPIALGAYYGDTPNDAAEVLGGRREHWKRTQDRTGWICPYLPCPQCGLQAMAWLEQDLTREEKENRRGVYGQYARLVCQECNTRVNSDMLRLTRAQMRVEPPDILFTTTEMLNRRLANAVEHEVFGISTADPPRLLLMDEIHLNEGIHGSQVAYLLRRWRFARHAAPQNSLCIVGLSATVTQAESFFARLTGVPSVHVTYIAPEESELVKEGIEYNIVLKGDPLSGTTLLSTSVRAAMLLCRILDPLHRDVSHQTYGQRVFAFSDKLDVINRWYHIEREVENAKEPYSRFLYVQMNDSTRSARNEQGQDWWLVSQIHEDAGVLNSGLRLDLTSSQYAGVDETANLVIASSTLEVGYNDPTVGGILQHKAPFSRAAFVQRKGRAGRLRTMRPWMIVVTSAYGHDRWAFQHAESLFDPLLPPLDLPLENYYVRKIQATFVLMDWLAHELKQAGQQENVWNLLRSDERMRNPNLNRARHALVKLLKAVLDEDVVLDSFKAYLRGALMLEQDNELDVNLLLWSEPRPLLLEVVPTLIRQLESDWQSTHRLEDGAWKTFAWNDAVSDRPLPEFVPATLFSDLKSPELLIQIPDKRFEAGTAPEIRAEETLSVTLALSEFTPGKVSKRFARREKIREAHWLEIPELENTNGNLELAQLAIEYDPTPTILTVDGENIAAHTPRRLTLNCTPRYVRPTSSADFVWSSQFDVQSRYAETDASRDEFGARLSLRRTSPLAAFIRSARVFTHASGTWAHVTRFATHVQVATRFEGGAEQRRVYPFAVNEQPAALSFALDADALCFELTPLDIHALKANAEWGALYERLGSDFYLHLIRHDERARALLLSELETEWLWHITLAMATQTAVQQQINLAQAAEKIRASFILSARAVMQILFHHEPATYTHTRTSEENNEFVLDAIALENESEEDAQELGYLEAKLLNLLSEPAIQALLLEHLAVVWSDEHPQLDAWLAASFSHSVGAALLSAFLELAPQVQADDLYLDVQAEMIWLSEAAAGGVGLVAKLADVIAQHPRRFELAFQKTLVRCPRERLASDLTQIARWIGEKGSALSDAFVAIRQASDLLRLEETRATLAGVLATRQIAFSRALAVALNVKFLRPNSSHDTDALIAALVEFWEREQARLDCALDLRMSALAAVQDAALRDRVQRIMARIGDDAQTRDLHAMYNLFQALLWLDCRDGCPDCIEYSQRYQRGVKASRSLLRMLLPQELNIVPVQDDWVTQAHSQLTDKYQVWLSAPQDRLLAFKDALWQLLARPIDTGDQFVYPALDRLEQDGMRWNAYLILPDLIETEWYVA